MMFMVPDPIIGNRPAYEFVKGKSQSGVDRGGYISGRVTEKELPVSRRIMCYHRRTGALVGSTLSNENGDYRFNDLSPNASYFVVSLDENNDVVQYNAVVQDLIAASTDITEVIIYPDGPIDNGEA